MLGTPALSARRMLHVCIASVMPDMLGDCIRRMGRSLWYCERAHAAPVPHTHLCGEPCVICGEP